MESPGLSMTTIVNDIIPFGITTVTEPVLSKTVQMPEMLLPEPTPIIDAKSIEEMQHILARPHYTLDNQLQNILLSMQGSNNNDTRDRLNKIQILLPHAQTTETKQYLLNELLSISSYNKGEPITKVIMDINKTCIENMAGFYMPDGVMKELQMLINPLIGSALNNISITGATPFIVNTLEYVLNMSCNYIKSKLSMMEQTDYNRLIAGINSLPKI